jgi:hypothetical protein
VSLPSRSASSTSASTGHPPGVHEHHAQAGFGELGNERALVATRRLDDDARGVERDELADELRDGPRLVAGVLDLLLPREVPLERVLGDVDSDTRGHGKLLRSNELGLSNTGSRKRPQRSFELRCGEGAVTRAC